MPYLQGFSHFGVLAAALFTHWFVRIISINPTMRKWFNCLIQRTCCHRNIPLLILSESMDAKFPTTFQSRSQTIHQRQCRWLKYILMPVCVFCFFHPISRSRNRPEVFFVSFAGIVNKSCAIQSVLSLVNVLTAVFSLEIFPWAYSFSHDKKCTLLHNTV